jgi:hypothetical protein
MTEEEIKAADAAKAKELEKLSVPELIDIIRETRSEAKQRRLKEKELSDRLEATETEKTKSEQDKKLAEGKKDEVITDLTKQLEAVKTKASEWDKYNETKRAQIKEQLKDNWMDSFGLIPLSELEILASKFNKDVKLLDSDNGTGKAKQPGKIEGLKADLKLAIEKKDLVAQMQIKNLISEEEKKK